LAGHYGLDGKLIQKYYKENLSDYRGWDQLSHAEDYILFPKNLSYHLCIDETALNSGELYTILSSKKGHGRKGTIVAVIKGTKAEDIINVLCKIPENERNIVKEVTLDMAGSMQKIIRCCFPKAIQVIDRFHVQKLAYDALQDLRISYRWQVISDEEDKIKQAKLQGRKYQAKVLANGDTLRQLLARSRYLLFKAPGKWVHSQKVRAKLLFEQFPDIMHLYHRVMQLGQIYSQSYDKNVARLKLAQWYESIEKEGYRNFSTVSQTIENNYERILNFFINRSTNAAAESFNAKLKFFRASFRGVTDMKFFLFRIAKIYA
jgi:transposase